MRLISAILVLVFCGAPTLGERKIQDQHSEKLRALRSLAQGPDLVVNPTTAIVFPQVADGIDSGIGIATSIVLSSNEEFPFTVTLTFRSSFGSAMSLSLFDSVTRNFLGTNSVFFMTIQPFQSLFLETSGSGGLTVGWASATSTGGEMGGVAAFQLFDATTNQFLTIVGVGASSATPSFFMPIFKSTSLNSNTALAVSNNSDSTVYLEIFLFGNDGRNFVDTISLGPRQQLARFVDELFAVGSQYFGTMHVFRVDAAGEVQFLLDIHPVALFLSNGILSSIPVTNIVPF